MGSTEIIILISKLLFSAIACFLAIVLWSNTRDSAWMVMVVGIIINYAELMYSVLEIFGLVETSFYVVGGIPLVRIIFSNLSTLLFIIAFIIMIKRYNAK